jgi:hypothetical protein
MEEWKRIPRHPLYEVSNYGNVRSWNDKGRGILSTPRTLITPPNSRGYAVTKIGHEMIYVHRLVAFAFIGPAPDGMHVNHKDGNKTNNWIGNLEYVTPQENSLHSTRVLGNGVGEKNGSAKLTEDQVREIKQLLNQGIPITVVAAGFGVSKSIVGYIKQGKVWKHITGDNTDGHS